MSSYFKTAAFFTAYLAATSVAHAGIPFFNAKCPGNFELHADEGGPVYINGKEAKLKVFNDSYYEARLHGFTASIAINPDGSPLITYTMKSGANGICKLKK